MKCSSSSDFSFASCRILRRVAGSTHTRAAGGIDARRRLRPHVVGPWLRQSADCSSRVIVVVSWKVERRRRRRRQQRFSRCQVWGSRRRRRRRWQHKKRRREESFVEEVVQFARQQHPRSERDSCCGQSAGDDACLNYYCYYLF